MPTIYLNADTGNDLTGDGTEALPFETIAKGHTEAAEGDTIILQDSVASYLFATLTITKALIIEGENPETRVFNGKGAVVDAAFTPIRFWGFPGDKTVTIKNLTFTRLSNRFNSLAFFFKRS